MSSPSLQRDAHSSAPLRLVPPKSRTSRSAITLGALLIAGSSLAFVVTALQVDHRPSVIVVRQAVAAGSTVKASDLGLARVSTDASLNPISAASMSKVVGRPAAVPLAPGTLLTDNELGAQSDLTADQSLVGVSVKAGQFPPGLSVGAHVQVVQTSSSASALGGSTTGTVIADGAVVTSVMAPSGNDLSASTIVGLKVSGPASASVAAASAAGDVGLVQEPQS